MFRKKSYLIELETVKDGNFYIHHLVCQSNGKLMISEIIKNLDAEEWRIISTTEIDSIDAEVLSDYLDNTKSKSV